MPTLTHAADFQQTKYYYCGPAAVAVVLSCQNQTVSQDVLAVELGTTVFGTGSSLDVIRVLNKRLGTGSYAARFLPGPSATTAEVAALKADLVAAIDAGEAIVANVVGTVADVDGRNYSYPGGHYVALTGYRTGATGGTEALVTDVANGREYWVTNQRLGTWIAERGYAYPLVVGGPQLRVGSEGVDYSFAKPSATGLIAAGKLFVGRYVGPGFGKLLDAAERDALLAAGLAIFLLAEGTADGATGGYPVGQAHARSARLHTRQLGIPDAVPVYYAVDYDITAANWLNAREYLRACCDVDGLARVGVYGDVQALEWAQRDGVASWFFQALAAASWSQSRVFAGNHVEQYRNGVPIGGGTVDLCRAKRANFGQWPLADGRPRKDPDMPKIFRVDQGGLTGISNGSTWSYLDSDAAVSAACRFWGIPEGLDRDGGGIIAINEADLAGMGVQVLAASTSGGGDGDGPGGPVTVAPESVTAIAKATADEIAADPERDGRDA